MKRGGYDEVFENLVEDLCSTVREKLGNAKWKLDVENGHLKSLNLNDINNNFLKGRIKAKDANKLLDAKLSPDFTSSRSSENLKDKEFIARPSLLTEMLEVNHIKTIYNIFVAILIVFSLNTIVFDLIEGEKFVWDFDLITYSLGQFPHVIVIWCCMKVATVIVLFPCYRLYALLQVSHLESELASKKSSAEFTSAGWHLGDKNEDDEGKMADNGEACHDSRELSDHVPPDLRKRVSATPRGSKTRGGDTLGSDVTLGEKVSSGISSSTCQKLSSIIWLGLYATYQILFLAIPIHCIIWVYDLPPASSFLITLEQLRLMMKTHSFVHENVFKIWSLGTGVREGRVVTERDLATLIPNFSQYLYFLFAPTLIYRDSYPRTTVIRWDYVVSNLLQVLTCLFYTYYIFVRFCIPVFKHFNQDHLTVKTLLLSVFGCMLPGTMVLLIAFFGVLHSWLNAFAEMLRFADRMFYKDWWNSNSFTNYYRTWNVVVHDWLYLYVYKDIRQFFGNSISRSLAMLIVFQISALAHEMVIAVSFRFFYPVLLVLFGIIGFAAMFITNKGVTRGWNILLWVMMFAGNGLLMTLYSMEWYARKNCRSHVGSKTADFFIPRSWYCHHDVPT